MDKTLNNEESVAGSLLLFPETAAPAITSSRLQSVDILRGLVMVIMALDHVRDYFSVAHFDPLDLQQTTPALFMTRWVTHFCAPIFVFLAGSGAFLQFHKGKSASSLSWFLITRGLWLVLLELTIVRWGWLFNLDYSLAIGQVIWAIGWAMVILAALVHLPPKVVGCIGVMIVVFHNLLDVIVPAQLADFSWLWVLLHEGGPVSYAKGMVLIVAYPLLPWVGVMAAGYGFGLVLIKPDFRRRRLLLWLGIGLTAAFIILRYINIYGDPLGWVPQQNNLFTLFSFLNTQKYPPSLLYCLMTLGPACLLLLAFDKSRNSVSRFFQTFGRVPLFYYLLHIPLVHGLAFLLALFFIKDYSFMTSNIPPWEWPAGWGFSLGVVYAAWVLVVALLYVPCRWFARYKQTHRQAWLSYL